MTIYRVKWPDHTGHIEFTKQENNTWKKLYARQLKVIKGRACNEFISGLEQLNMPKDRIPQLPEINATLAKTGWSMCAVDGTIAVTDFFTLLKQKQFPTANFIRIPKELDYLQQPDVFHELFGHAPLLMHPAYADFMQWYGEFALSLDGASQRIFSRAFWYSIEFGLIKTASGLRILGGGILSSFAETLFSLESTLPQRRDFTLDTVLATPYHYDAIQNNYFKLDGFESLYALRDDPALAMLCKKQLVGQEKAFITC